MAQVWDLREEEGGIELAADLESLLCDNGPAILDELLEWPPVRDVAEIVSVFPRTKPFFFSEKKRRIIVIGISL